MKDGDRAIVIGPPGSGKSTQESEENRPLVGEVGLLECDEHASTCERSAMAAIHDGHEELLIDDDLNDIHRVVNHRSTPVLLSEGVQLELDRMTLSDDLRQGIIIQRGFDTIFDHPWIQEYLTFAIDVIVCLGLPLRWLAYVYRFGHRNNVEILARAPRWIREKFADLMTLSKLERDRMLGPVIRMIGNMLRGPCLRERFDWPGETIDSDDHFRRGGAYFLKGRGVSSDQYRIVALFMILRAIAGAMRGGYRLKITIDEAAPLVSAYLIRKLEEVRKFGISVTLLMQYLPTDVALRGRLLKACNRHVWYACTDPEERKIAVADLIQLIDRNKTRWTEQRYVQLRGPVVEEQRITETESTSKGKKGDKRITKGISVTIVEKQLWETFIQEFPHFEQTSDLIFDLEQRLAGLRVGERAVVDWSKGIAYIEQTKKPRPLMPGCPGLAKERYREALRRIKQRGYYRTPMVEEESCGAAARLMKMRDSGNG